MSFITNLTKKLEYATEAKLLTLPAVTTTEVTTANTVVPLVNVGSKVNNFDIIDLQYIYQIENGSGTNEAFTSAVLFDNQQILTATATINDTVTATCNATIKAVKSDINYVVTVTLTHGATTVSKVLFMPLSEVAKLAITTKNDTIAAAGCEVTGLGGYLLLDHVNRV
jgi:hypothetical protein